ncbi:BTB/POZ domain containing protein [Acanthamoeba castellanii str. Neff]|uniref:BTB/POZ domain containing protein n=1 Tax=Acanthamoeba castellanii (strain ATCC 30010 / Neff) TaxID=1257118 RepID=L8H7P1_ACACF|nr:BTB/POZ domain containing protein [Acanthamoeba castellanii str. Neff]ELR21140.1 BTB/POZ domain containing protein [Acanthamoeba castellanii str. Neff]
MDKTQVWTWSPRLFSPPISEYLADASIAAVYSGFAAQHNVAVSDVSDIYVWGSGQVGQLGLDPESEFELEDQYVSHPQRLRHEALLHKRVLQVCCGRDWTACLTDAGLYTWGSNAYNQLGHHHQRELFTLMRELKQSYPSSPDAKWGYWRVDEPVESEHESESEGQAAERSPVERSQGLEKSRELTGCRLASSTTWLCATPKLVGGPLLNKTIVHVACGAQHMACVTDEGDVFTWGYGGRGALGHPNIRITGEPMLVEYFRSPGGDAATRIFIKSVACGESFTIAVAANGHAYGWGEHAFGQLGLGPIPETPMQHSAFYPCPTLISSLAEANQVVVSVACGASHTLFLTDVGHVYSCGSNVLGQLGNGTDHSLPVCIESLKSTKVTSISCGELFSAAVTDRGELWMWGAGSGQFGCKEGRHAEYPGQVGFVGNVRQVACRSRSVMTLLGPPREASRPDYQKMLFARDFSDITFRLDNQAEIPAHKAILAARCPALLSLGAEDGGGAVLLPDVNEAVFRKLLEFIYTGDFALLASAGLNDELYRLALELNFTGLVRKCAMLLGRPVPDAHQAAGGSAVRHIDDLREDLLRLLREPQFSDCTLRVEQQPGLEAKTFECHRAVLSARCPFFEAMLSADRGYKESQQAVISLSMPFDNDDVDAGSTVAELLKWIYAERFDPAPDTSQALLVLADEYRLPLLAQMCETLIQEGVDETNVCDVLQFAETFRANKLRSYCIDYMAAPTFPSHLIDAAQLKPELLEQIQLRKGSWSEHSRSRRKVKEREARYQQYEEERQTQVQRWAARDSPLFALGQALRESLERFDQAVAQADPAAKAPCWPRWMWRMSRQERRERLERLHAERKQRKEAKRLRRLEEQEQAAAAQRERDEAQRRKRERMNRVFIRADPAASTSQERPAAGLSELVEDDRQEETKSAAAYEGKTEKLDKGKEKAVDSDNEEEIDDFEAPLDLEQQQGREEEAPNYDKATLTLMDTTQQATDVSREVAFLRATLTAIQAEFGQISPKGALQLEVRALRREFNSIEEEARSLAPQVSVALDSSALSQEVVALRAELDAIEREAEQLVLERASQSLPPSLLVLPKEVRAIRAEFDAIEREAQSLAAECRAHSIVDPLLPKEVSAIRAEFDAIKRQAQQLAAWREAAVKEVSALRDEFAAIELAAQALQITLREADAHEEVVKREEVTVRSEEEERGYESEEEEEVKQNEEEEEEEMKVRGMRDSAESPDGREDKHTTDEEKEKDRKMEDGEDDDNEELNRAIRLVEQAFALEREDPAKADHLFTQSSIGFLQAMRIADAQGKSDVRRIVDGYIARIDARNLRRSAQMIKRKESESLHSAPEEEFMATSGMELESCDYGQLVADSSEEVATVSSLEEVVPQDSYLTAVLSDELPRRATNNTPLRSPVVDAAAVATSAAPSTADTTGESESEVSAELLASAEMEPEDGAYMQAVVEEEEEADTPQRSRASTVELRRDAAEAAAEVLNTITAGGSQAQTTGVSAAARWKPADNNGARKHDALANTRVTAPALRDINRRSEVVVVVCLDCAFTFTFVIVIIPNVNVNNAVAVDSTRHLLVEQATRLEPAARPKRPASTSFVSGRVSSSLASRLALFESPSSSSTSPPQQPNSTTQTTPQLGPSSPVAVRATSFGQTRPAALSTPQPPGALGLRRRSSITTFQSPATATVAQDAIERYQQQQQQSAEVTSGQRPAATAAASNGHETRTLSYVDLKDNRSSLPDWVDQAQLEVYLSDEDFGVVFQMSRQEFNALKSWRRNQFKKAAGLF